MPGQKPEAVFKAGAVRASVFLNTFEQNGKTIPIRKVVLEVRRSNVDALKLYETLGFSRVGVRKDYYRTEKEDAILMEVFVNKD